jgi:hypothetical protein
MSSSWWCRVGGDTESGTASCRPRSNISHLLELVDVPMPGFIIFVSGPCSVCSGAIFQVATVVRDQFLD